ncbi:FMN-dependent NADH-azoreductase [Flavobacterium sp. GA093]|uniref:FMN dependent NADH:quinone oxidoreductase n=1 Tax=Flavobacterium hydrocarbonoxydans TaxID=2683249 RepID=A0A6I4NSR5_9FLAO|nr:NAD(P)H-dependent oxidoreductase [Flavobacterium hydrocarbonoxydans]MWB96072.1 FMN-dependent NADH-azoreductase [Flavobacterium hydrocarbonoxydans]
MSSKRILQLNSSIMGEQSYSRKLGNAIVEKIQQKYPESTVEELDLVENNIPHLTPETLQAIFTPVEHQTAEMKQRLELSDKLVKQVFESDIIVIGAPLINLTIHSSLKAWIDHITRRGITFGYTAEGLPTGLVEGKKVYVAMSSGGVYTDEQGKANDFVAPYLKSFLGFLGMKDLTVFRAEGLHVPVVQDTALEKGINSIIID